MENAVEPFLKAIGSRVANAESVDDVVAALRVLRSVAFDGFEARIEDADGLGNIPKLANACKGQIQLFHKPGVFAVVAKLLLYSKLCSSKFRSAHFLSSAGVAPDWLACFTENDRDLYFDAFFLLSPPAEVLLTLVPALTIKLESESKFDESIYVSMQVERLLSKCLVESLGVKRIAEHLHNVVEWETIRQVAQLISSIPDRLRPKALASLRAPMFFHAVVSQLVLVFKERWQPSVDTRNDGTVMFVGEVFTKLCRRGNAGVIAEQLMIEISCYSPTSTAQSTYLQAIVFSIRDLHALERLSEAILFSLAKRSISDQDAFYSLHTFFGGPLSDSSVRYTGKNSQYFTLSVLSFHRTLFTDRFLLWRTFPFRVLKWILDFAVLCHPPVAGDSVSQRNKNLQKDVVKSLAETWAERNHIQAASIDQQAYLTAALRLCLKAMTKDELLEPGTDGLSKCLLVGISRRLESPVQEVRRMAKQIALALSSIITPGNPLLLDDGDNVEDLNKWDVWEQAGDSLQFGETDTKRKVSKAVSDPRINDPDAVVDLKNPGGSCLDDTSDSDEESGSEASLTPYDMLDDESDLDKGKFPSQLSDCAANLRKSDDADNVERALEVCEKLVRFRPDELEYSAADLAHALVHVRCSDVTKEGQEDTAEIRRQRALVALLVCAPLPTADVLTKELYSVHVDGTQRLLILDVLSDAAEELAKGAEQNQTGRQEPGPWKEVSYPCPETSWISWGQAFERELPPKPGQRELGKSRRWGSRSLQLRKEKWNGRGPPPSSKNNFAPVAAAFMLPIMRDYDKRRRGLDILGNDYILLANMIRMLGVCMECLSFQTDAAAIGTVLLDMLRSRSICKHPEPYVRRAVIFAASRVLVALHPSHLVSMDASLADGLEWIRDWSLEVASNDPDAQCAKMATACLHIQSEVAFQASRSSEASEPASRPLIMPI